MILVQAALVLVIGAAATSGWITGLYDGAILIGLVAGVVLARTAGVFRRETWTEPVRVQDVTGELPTIESPQGPRGPWWELVLAFVVAPVLVAVAVCLIVRAVSL